MGLYRVTTKDNTPKLKKEIKRINFRNIEHILARLRLKIQKLIGEPRKKPRPPGKPAGSPTGQLRRSIRYALEQSTFSAGGVIGPSRSDIGLIGRIQEAGGESDIKQVRMLVRRKDGKVRLVKGPVVKTKADFPARPFMAPAMQWIKPRLSDFWKDALKGLNLPD